MRDIVIFGTGGFAREVHELIEDLQQVDPSSWNVVGFLDGNSQKHGTIVHDLPVLGGAEWIADHPGIAVVVAIGNTAVRRRVTRELCEIGSPEFPTLVHPSAVVGRRVEFGVGTVVCAGALLTTDIKVGNYVIINLATTVGHDTTLDDYVTIAPSANISGTVHVGAGCDLGTNSTIIQGMTIGEWTILGAGAVVVGDIPPNVTAVGVPAKPIKERPTGWQENA